MRKLLVVAIVAGALTVGSAGVVFADLVCPVLTGAAGDHSPNAIEIADGDASILPGKAGNPDKPPVDVPDGATNDDGAGSPGGAHASPGDPVYSGVWNTPQGTSADTNDSLSPIRGGRQDPSGLPVVHVR